MYKYILITLLSCLTISAFSQKNVVVSDTNLSKDYTSTLDALRGEVQLAGGTGPASVNWIDKGRRFSYITNEAGRQQIRAFDIQTKEDVLIFDPLNIKATNGTTHFTYTSFQWSLDSKYILFQSNFRPIWRKTGIADYYFYSLADKTLKLVAKDAQTAEISPDGTKVGFERNGNLFVFDFKTEEDIQLTFDAKEYFYNGRSGWVYAEEFALSQAWLWSPDSKYIAFWQTDEHSIPLFQMTDYSGQHPSYFTIPYPKVGDPIPEVKIGVIDVSKKSISWMNINVDGGYIPRLYWTAEPGILGVVHLNRKQNHLTLLFCDIVSGNARPIMDETSEKWIDVFNFVGTMHFFLFPENKKEFFWVSDRDGWNHIYKYDYNGKLLKQITKGGWEVSRIEAVNSKTGTIYYSSTEGSPLDRRLYGVDFNGNNKTRFTYLPGMHRFNVAPDGENYIDSYSSANTPLKVELRSAKNKLVKVFEDNVQVQKYLATHFYAPRELFSFNTSDGQKLDGYILKPEHFDPQKKYPLLLNIYGGPSSQFVLNEFGTDSFEQYLAQKGYVIVNVNNRGTTGYGRDFQKSIYRNLGKYQSYDFVETAKYMSAFPWIDANKIAIKGRSYGGFISSFTMLKYPGVFKVALVAAGVTDWTLYDATYTERYMDLLADNKEGYRNNSSVALAGNLQGKMFLAHSGLDDNVHLQNTMQLMNAFIEKGKDADLRIFPKGGHRVGYNEISQALLYAQYLDYLNRYLKGDNTTHETDLINN